MALDDNLTLDNLTGPIDELMKYIPPASAAYRSYIAPGFWSTGQAPSNTPNPLKGDAAEAAPVSGENGFVAPPPPAAPSSFLQNLTSTDPSARGSTLDERTSARVKDVGDAGEVTDPADFARAVNLGLSLTGPIGIAGLVGSEALQAAGVDPFGIGSAFDIKSNLNKKPGWSAAYNAAIQNGATPQAALNAARQTVEANDPALTNRDRLATNPPATPTPMDVTAANKVTGWSAPQTSGGSTNIGSPAPPASSGTGALGTATPAANTSPGVAAPAPATTGTSGAGSVSAINRTDGVMSSGTVNDMTNRDRGAGAAGPGSSGSGGGGGVGSNAGRRGFADGGVVPNDPSQMFRAATQSTMPADIGQTADPHQDERYNPPAEMQDPQGVVDGVPAQLTPGEFVIMRDAAQQYDPEVLAALNDPRVADQINELIESLLGGPESDDEEDEDPSRSDDNSGLGVAGQTTIRRDPRTAMNSGPQGGSMLRSLSRVA